MVQTNDRPKEVILFINLSERIYWYGATEVSVFFFAIVGNSSTQ